MFKKIKKSTSKPISSLDPQKSNFCQIQRIQLYYVYLEIWLDAHNAGGVTTAAALQLYRLYIEMYHKQNFPNAT